MKNKKIILEILVIPLLLGYLFYQLLGVFNNIKLVSVIVLCIFNIELLTKYIREVNIYKSKYNIYKVLFIIFNIISLFVSFVTIYKKLYILYFIICSIITLVYFLVRGVLNIIKISKSNNKLYGFAKVALLSFFAFFIIFACLIKLI